MSDPYIMHLDRTPCGQRPLVRLTESGEIHISCPDEECGCSCIFASTPEKAETNWNDKGRER